MNRSNFPWSRLLVATFLALAAAWFGQGCKVEAPPDTLDISDQSAQTRGIDSIEYFIQGANFPAGERIYLWTSGTEFKSEIPIPGDAAGSFYLIVTAWKGKSVASKKQHLIRDFTIIQTVDLFALIPITLEGKVLDAQGKPLAGVGIQVKPNSGTVANAVTDTAGRFALDNLPKGGFTITARKYRFADFSQSVILNYDTIMAPIRLTENLVDWTAKALDRFQGPIAFAEFDLKRNGTTVYSKVADRLGGLTLKDLETGRYEVQVSAEGFVSILQSVDVSLTQRAMNAVLSPQSLPSAGVLRTEIKRYSRQQIELESEIFAVDKDAVPIPTLGGGDFRIDTLKYANGAVDVYTQKKFEQIEPGTGNAFSVALLLDQSGSISGTDPNSTRLQASKIFLDALGANDEVAVGAFASGGMLKTDPVTIWPQGFTSAGSTYFPVMDSLAGLVDGGTPLYKSIYAMVQYTAQNARKPRKAVLVFTDGEDTDGFPIDSVFAISSRTGISVYTMGLSESVDARVLGELASKTGGAFMYAGDARQLVSLFGTLGNILAGRAPRYKITWIATRQNQNYGGVGSWFTFNLFLDSQSGIVPVPIYGEISTSSVFTNSDFLPP